MSLILKGLDMPKTPKRIIIYPDGTIVDGDKKGTKILKAQAIPIPTPHGRLIDESKMTFYYEERWTYTSNGIEKDRTRIYRDEDVLNAPTILEAEE